MVSRPGEMPALESGTPDGLLGGMSLPIGMTRRALSYDDALEAPMSPPPTDINVNILWKRPIIPERKFQRLTEEDESESVLTHTASFDSEATKPPVPVVKAKASSVIMNSLMTKQTQESMQSKFEKQAGLTDTGYTPHKGLAAEETRYHRMAESLHKLKVQSESGEEKQSSSTQSTPSNTPQASPKQKRKGWFSQGSVASLTGSEISTVPLAMEPANSEVAGAAERWSAFGPRPVVQKSATDPGTGPATAGGFALQAYKGAQKPTPMEVMKAQGTRLVEDPANLKAPKMEIPVMEGKRHSPRQHKLRPRDMNVLTPSGF